MDSMDGFDGWIRWMDLMRGLDSMHGSARPAWIRSVSRADSVSKACVDSTSKICADSISKIYVDLRPVDLISRVRPVSVGCRVSRMPCISRMQPVLVGYVSRMQSMLAKYDLCQ
jgi:hypothetical protein